MSRIGVFLCHCGINIAGTVDVARAAEAMQGYPGVVYATDYTYMCSDPGQALIRQAIAEHELDGIVIAACSPSMHEATFRRAAEAAGLNPYQVEIANIREQCAWVHQEARDEATHKAIAIIASLVEKVRRDEPLAPLGTPITRRLMVIGGGIAGLSVALEVAGAGYEVVLVEREAELGGRLRQIRQTYAGLEPLAEALAERLEAVRRHPQITVLTRSAVQAASGFVGNFQVEVRTEATKVATTDSYDVDTPPAPASAGGSAAREGTTKVADTNPEATKVATTNSYDVDTPLVPASAGGSAAREETTKAAATNPEATKVATTDRYDDASFVVAASAACPSNDTPLVPASAGGSAAREETTKAATTNPEATKVATTKTYDVGAIVVATGYELLPLARLGEYGGGAVPDVVDALEFERLLGQATLRRPSDGRVPRRVVFVQCAGSRDPERGLAHCSTFCCLYTAKQALLYRQRVPDGQATVFYIDLRTAGRRYEEFVQRAMEEGVVYLRGKVAKVFRQGDEVMVWGADTLAGRMVEMAADLVVLAVGAVPAEGAAELGRCLRATTDGLGFFHEAHPKLRPVESLTAGIYLAGAAQAPKGIAETVSQAEAAAAKVLSLFSHRELVQEPTVAVVDPELCAACGLCVPACPYEARQLDARLRLAAVNPALCQGCGACVTACPNKACAVRNARPLQYLAMLDAALSDA